MSSIKYAMVFFGLLLLVSMAAAASCSAKAYSNACANCQFDANGKIDQQCSGGYKASGIACVSSSYPIMATKYSAGQCPQVDECASELQSCVSQYSTGDDRADCQEGSLGVCYAASDECVKSAAVKCGEVEKQCSAPEFIMLLVGLGLAFVKFSEK